MEKAPLGRHFEQKLGLGKLPAQYPAPPGSCPVFKAGLPMT
jgi:hypothetical protein